MTADPCETPTQVTVAEGFHVRVAIDNIAWIDLGGTAIVIDAMEEAHLKDEVFAAIRATLGDTPVRYVLNTHTHYDHIALNSAFVSEFGAEVISQPVSTIPDEGRWFEGTTRRAHMLPMPGCHTDEDCIVWLPDDKALFTGDIFGWGLVPLTVNFREATFEHLLECYARLIEYGAETVIAGHGPLLTTAELERCVTYYLWLQEQVSAACAEGLSDEEVLARVKPPDDMRTWWRFLAWKHEDSVSKMTKALRRGWLA